MAISKDEFKKDLENGVCPFCKKKMKFYDGSLGYEALKCYKCKFTVDNTGINFEEVTEPKKTSEDEEDFMDSYEDNDILGEFIREELKKHSGEYEVIINYHDLGDGIHRVTINQAYFKVRASYTKSTVREIVKSALEHFQNGLD
jgi:hypothetical protein